MRKQNSDFEARFISEEGSRLKTEIIWVCGIRRVRLLCHSGRNHGDYGYRERKACD